jgi:uncharacterized protein (TIGR03437 family)
MVIYCAGSGVVNPVTVTFGGQNANVPFAGLSPSFMRLYPIKVLARDSVARDHRCRSAVKYASARNRSLSSTV